MGAHFLRGGAFKPLTFPYRSKNIQKQDLKVEMVKTSKNEAKIPVITEIMEEKYLDEVCEVADILQIDLEICKLPINHRSAKLKANLKDTMVPH